MPKPISLKFSNTVRELKADLPPLSAGTKALVSAPPAPPSVETIVGALTKKLDASGDGKVSLSEMSSVLDPKSKFPVIDKMLGNLVQRVDVSKDGLIDKGEWIKTIGALDKNADGLLSRPEMHHGPDVLLALVGVVPHDPPPGG